MLYIDVDITKNIDIILQLIFFLIKMFAFYHHTTTTTTMTVNCACVLKFDREWSRAQARIQ